MEIFSDAYFMRIALQEAQKAFDADEIPIGAVIASNNRILAKSHNSTEQLLDVTAHAEILAITAASSALGSKYLNDCTLYVTMEPCVMCAGALYWSQIGRVVVGCSNPKTGFISAGVELHPSTEFLGGVLEEECSQLVKLYFENKR